MIGTASSKAGGRRDRAHKHQRKDQERGKRMDEERKDDVAWHVEDQLAGSHATWSSVCSCRDHRQLHIEVNVSRILRNRTFNLNDEGRISIMIRRRRWE